MVNMEITLIIFFAAKDGEALYSQQKQDCELTVAQIMNSLISKFRLKLKTVEKTTRPFRYDLNKIPHDYTVEVLKRFKGLDLVDRILEKEMATHSTILAWRIPGTGEPGGLPSWGHTESDTTKAT